MLGNLGTMHPDMIAWWWTYIYSPLNRMKNFYMKLIMDTTSALNMTTCKLLKCHLTLQHTKPLFDVFRRDKSVITKSKDAITHSVVNICVSSLWRCTGFDYNWIVNMGMIVALGRDWLADNGNGQLYNCYIINMQICNQ